MKKKNKVHNPKILFIYICAMIGILGMEAGGLQYNLLLIAEELGLSATQMGSMASIQHIAFIVIPLLFGGIGDKYGKKIIMILFGFSFALGCLAVILSNGFFLVAAGVFFMGAGYAMCESTGTSILSDMYHEESSKYINWSQSVFSIGALVSPLLSQWLVDIMGLNWRIFFAVLMIGYVFLSMWALALKFPPLPKQIEEYKETPKEKKNGASQLSKDTKIKMGILSAAIAVYAGMESGIAYFIGTHVSSVLGTEAYNSITLSLFWLLMIPSRYIAGVVKTLPRKMLKFCYIASALSIGAVIFMTNSIGLMIAYACAGFFFGPIWPLIMGEAGNLDPANSAKISGRMTGFCGLGGVISPTAFGFFADHFNLSVSLTFVMTITLAGWILSLVYNKLCKK